MSTRAKSCIWTAPPYYQEKAGRNPVQLHLISHAQLRGVRRTTRTSCDRPEPAAAGCRQAWAPRLLRWQPSEICTSEIRGHATLQTPMGIYHANPQGFQTQVSLRKLCSFSTEMPDSRQERTVQMPKNKIRLELSLKRNYSPYTAVDNN